MYLIIQPVNTKSHPSVSPPPHRMVCHVNALLRCLLKLMLDLSSDSDLSDVIRQKLMNEATVCIQLLDGCCHGNLQVSLDLDGCKLVYA